MPDDFCKGYPFQSRVERKEVLLKKLKEIQERIFLGNPIESSVPMETYM